MQYEQQKAACAEYAQQNGGSVADVLRVSGRKGAVVLSKDGRTIYDPFVIEPIKERVQEEVKIELPAPAPKKKAPVRKKK